VLAASATAPTSGIRAASAPAPTSGIRLAASTPAATSGIRLVASAATATSGIRGASAPAAPARAATIHCGTDRRRAGMARAAPQGSDEEGCHQRCEQELDSAHARLGLGSKVIWTRRAALATIAALAESGRSDEGAFERRSRREHVSDTREERARGEW